MHDQLMYTFVCGSCVGRCHSWPPRTWSHYGQFFIAFLKSQMFVCKPWNESPCRKGGLSRSRAYPLRPIDTGTIPFCGGPSAKPDCKHKHYELFYVTHYELSIVSQPFLCVFQNRVFIMFLLFFAPAGPSFCRPYQPRGRPNVQDMRSIFRHFFRPQVFVWSRAKLCDIFIAQ